MSSVETYVLDVPRKSSSVVAELVGMLAGDQLAAVFQSPVRGEVALPPPVNVAAAETDPALANSVDAAAAITIRRPLRPLRQFFRRRSDSNVRFISAPRYGAPFAMTLKLHEQST